MTTTKTILLAASVLISGAASAQEKRGHEIERDMPLFLDSLKTEFKYPMAWGNSEITDFNAWRSDAKDRLAQDMLLPPPRANSYDRVILESQHRDGYTAYKIAFNLTKYS